MFPLGSPTPSLIRADAHVGEHTPRAGSSGTRFGRPKPGIRHRESSDELPGYSFLGGHHLILDIGCERIARPTILD
jgi:hypothetical protein